jgi:hypothetical protein
MMFERLSRLSLREKVGLGLAVLFLLGVVADRLIVRTVVRGFRRLETAITEEKVNLKHFLSVAQQEEPVAREYEKVRGLVEEVTATSSAIDRMKGQVDRLASESGLMVISMEHREPRSLEFSELFAVEVGRFEAGIQNVLKFLTQIESTPGMLRVSKLNLSPVRGKDLVRGSMLITKVMIPRYPSAAGAE